MVAMGDTLVYTDRDGKPEHVLDASGNSIETVNDIHQTAMLMETEGIDFESQRETLEGLSETGRSLFRTPEDVQTSERLARRRAYNFAEQDSGTNRSELPGEARAGTETGDRSVKFSTNTQERGFATENRQDNIQYSLLEVIKLA